MPVVLKRLDNRRCLWRLALDLLAETYPDSLDRDLRITLTSVPQIRVERSELCGRQRRAHDLGRAFFLRGEVLKAAAQSCIDENLNYIFWSLR